MSTSVPSVPMHRKTARPSPQSLPERVGALVWQYGFRTVDYLQTVRSKDESRQGTTFVAIPQSAAETPASARTFLKDSQFPACVRSSLLPSPDGTQLMIYSTREASRASERNSTRLSLEIFGVPGALAEALLLKTALAVLEESRVPGNVIVRVNSLGDRESSLRFLRECSAYFARRKNGMHPSCAAAVRTNVLKLFQCRHPHCKELCVGAPRPIGFLSERSREHLKEMLEYLETMGVTYELDGALFLSEPARVKTTFEVITRTEDGKTEVRHAFGGRYGDSARLLGLRHEIPAAGLSVTLPCCGPFSATKTQSTGTGIYFVQIGSEARRRGLTLLDMLRFARIPVYIPLTPQTLNAELRHAEELRTPYIFIMGHKEAVEGTIIVRESETRAQKTILVAELMGYLKKMRLPGAVR